MSLRDILILILMAILVRVAFPNKLRRSALLVSSILAIFWLQPALPIRNMDFWFPTGTLGLVFLSWAVTVDKDALSDRDNWLAGGLALATLLLIALTRFVSLEGLITPTRPPQFILVLIILLAIAGITFMLARLAKPRRTTISIGIGLLLLIFIVLKTPFLSLASSFGLRRLMSQDPGLARSTDLGWLGFSYVAFRLIHTLIDRVNGRLKNIKLGEYLVYTIFFPAFIAGPLDRLQRFQKELNVPQILSGSNLKFSAERLAIGLFRKFILADSLAFIAISATNVTQVKSAGWLWVMLIAYAFQIYLDFAGYTDIAIGTGMLLGFSLPENFNRPYRKPNLTLFWNDWHITLTQWFRAYFFFPLTRYLRTKSHFPAPLIIFITQMSTMLLIGLWHGITINFLIWGAWHGLGLFVQNRWSAITAPKIASLTVDRPLLSGYFRISGVLLTFFFVSLGWIWFALPSTGLALETFSKLFGRGS